MPVLNIPYTKYDPATGRILQTGNMHTTDFPVHTGPDSAMMSGHGNALTQYVVDQTLVERPTLTLPATIMDLGVDEDWPPLSVPPGTLIEVDGVDVGTTDETDLILSFGLARVWNVTFYPPFPWIEASCEVTVI